MAGILSRSLPRALALAGRQSARTFATQAGRSTTVAPVAVAVGAAGAFAYYQQQEAHVRCACRRVPRRAGGRSWRPLAVRVSREARKRRPPTRKKALAAKRS